MKPMKNGINPKQRAFIDAWLVSRNGTQAAIQAGYAAGSAAVTASRLLTQAKIQAEISRRLSGIEQKADISAERVLAELAMMAFIDVGSLFDPTTGQLLQIHQIPVATRRALAGVTIEDGAISGIRLEKRTALDSLAKILGLIQPGSINLVQIQQHAAATFLGSVGQWANRLDEGREEPGQITCTLHHSHGADCAIGSSYEARRAKFWEDEFDRDIAAGIRRPRG
jgi:phage terminase small subunit